MMRGVHFMRVGSPSRFYLKAHALHIKFKDFLLVLSRFFHNEGDYGYCIHNILASYFVGAVL